MHHSWYYVLLRVIAGCPSTLGLWPPWKDKPKYLLYRRDCVLRCTSIYCDPLNDLCRAKALAASSRSKYQASVGRGDLEDDCTVYTEVFESKVFWTARHSNAKLLAWFLQRLSTVIQTFAFLVNAFPFRDPVINIPQTMFIEDVAPIDHY